MITDRELAALGRALDFILSLVDGCDDDRHNDTANSAGADNDDCND